MFKNTSKRREWALEVFTEPGSSLACQPQIFKGVLFHLLAEFSIQSTRLLHAFALMWEFPEAQATTDGWSRRMEPLPFEAKGGHCVSFAQLSAHPQSGR